MEKRNEDSGLLPSDEGTIPPNQATKTMADALVKYAEWCGGVHDQDCPEDDTCHCSGKWINDGVTAAVNYLKAARLAPGAETPNDARKDATHIWCPTCEAIRPLLRDDMGPDPEQVDATDLLCGTCRFVIATLHYPSGDAGK